MSVPAAEALQEAGVDARSLNGGYLAWLMESMKQKEEAQKEEETYRSMDGNRAEYPQKVPENYLVPFLPVRYVNTSW